MMPQGYFTNILTTPIMLLLPVVGVLFGVIPGAPAAGHEMGALLHMRCERLDLVQRPLPAS